MNWRRYLPRLGRPRLRPAAWKQAGFPLWLVLILAVSFLIGFYLSFPLAPFAGQLEQLVATRSQVRLQVIDPDLKFPPAVSARLHLSSADDRFPDLDISSLRISPLWGSLVSATPGVSFAAKLLGGSATGSIRRDGTCSIDLSGLSAEGLQLSPQLKMRLNATGAGGSFAGQIDPNKPSQGDLKLDISSLQFSGMQALGASRDILQAGRLRAEASLRGSNLNISSLELAGGDLEVSGSGNLLLTGRPETSRLNINLTLKPTATLDPQLKDLLGLLGKPQPDGSLRLRLSGSLTAPQMR